MAEGDWDEVTVIRKRAPKAGQLKTPQVTFVIQYGLKAYWRCFPSSRGDGLIISKFEIAGTRSLSAISSII